MNFKILLLITSLCLSAATETNFNWQDDIVFRDNNGRPYRKLVSATTTTNIDTKGDTRRSLLRGKMNLDESMESSNSPSDVAHDAKVAGTFSSVKPPLPVPGNDREVKVWEAIKTMDSYKKPPLYGTMTDGRPTLSKFKFVVLPVWWSDMDVDNSNFKMDLDKISTTLQQNTDYYLDMSFNKMEITYDIKPQQVLTGVSSTNADFGNTEDEAKNIVQNTYNYVKDVDYDGIMLIYFPAQNGPFQPGGWGSVNSDLTMNWMSYELDLSVTRHEVGHNVGHPHHERNSYKYRFTRPNLTQGEFDMFDMMSGGNGYEISDFNVAAKWFYNWVPDFAVVSMQPEGATDSCPSCKRSGTYTLKAFDSRGGPPTGNDIMGIHIPITTIGNIIYSYWISYRGENQKAAGGLSIHLVWYELRGYFGMTYESLNYDVYGGSDRMDDSFVTVGTCYHVSPAAYLVDRALQAVNEVQPIVCADSIDFGKSMVATVSFLNTNNLPSGQSANVVSKDMKCSQSGQLSSITLDGSKFNLFHYTGTGSDGVVSIKMCPTSGFVEAYFLDSYPYSSIHYKSPASYGAFKELSRSTLSCCEAGSTVNVSGAKVVKVSNNRSDFLHLNEIEIYNKQGQNIALNGKCFSKNIGYGGDPNALNDGIVGTFPQTGNSHSSWTDPGNYDYCVLDEVSDISTIKIYPFVDPTRTWMTDRLRNLKIEVFADVQTEATNENDVTEFVGLMYVYDLVNVFTSSSTGPNTNSNVNLQNEIECPNTDEADTPFSYQTLFGETWVAIPPVTDTALTTSTVNIDISCSLSRCNENHFLDNGACVKCPDNSYSEAGATSVTQCKACPGGTMTVPDQDGCFLSETWESIESAQGWRIWAPDYHTASGWAWDIDVLEFFENENCQGSRIDPSGSAVSSGYANESWQPKEAFDGFAWGGRPDDDGVFWLGMMFSSDITVLCVKMKHYGDKVATEVRIQAYDGSVWKNAYIAKSLLPNDMNIIPLLAPPVIPPVTPPVTPPIAPPVTPPVTPPVAPPVTPPVTTPVTPPVAPPVTPPIAPPVTPVTPPIAPPVTPPVTCRKVGVFLQILSYYKRLGL